VSLFGGFADGGIESKKVVDVPRDNIASPGVERAITLAGLSPVKGATRQPVSNSWSGQAISKLRIKWMYRERNPIFESNRDGLCRAPRHLQRAPP